MTATSETVALIESHDDSASDAGKTTTTALTKAAKPNRRRRPWRTRRFASPTLVLSIAWIALIILSALVPGIIAPGDPLSGDVALKLQPPSSDAWFGTDQLGRDMFTRTVHGAGLTIKAVLIAVGFGITVGSVLGAIAGFAGSWVDAILMRITDVLLAIPSLLLSLAVIVALGFGTVNVAIAVGVGSIASVARLLRAEVLKVKHAAFVDAARAGGATRFRLLWRHVLPNSFGPVLSLAVLEFGTAILAISALSFLGYGAEPPAPEWGALVSDGRDYLAAQGWISTLPGAVIAATVLSVNRIARSFASPGGRR